MLAGIEAGGTKFVCAVAEHPAYIRDRVEFPTTTPEDTFAKVRDFLAAQKSISGIGIAAFGPIDIDRQSRTYATVLNTPKPGWSGASYKRAFSSFSVPMKVESDVSGACLGEYAHGAGKRQKTLAYVTVGTGIGAGIVHQGKVRGGIGHYEVGHITVRHDHARDPYPGRCPFHGDCLEGLACGPAIVDRYGRQLSDFAPNSPEIGLQADYLSELALTLILTQMPGRIVFGGGVMKTPGLMDALRQRTRHRLAGYVTTGPLGRDFSDYLVPPELGHNAGVIGALELARQAVQQAADR